MWAGLEEPLLVTTQQYAQCRGESAREVVMKHPDFYASRAVNFTIPNFKVTRFASPKYVIVLENSVVMNTREYWDFIRTACRNFILHGLPASAQLGIVLFNDAAHIAHPIVQLGDKEKSKARQSLSLQIKSKHNLSPSGGSCVKCGVNKAIEALLVSGSSLGGVIIIISRGQGSTTYLAEQEHQTLESRAVKHQLQLFSVSIPQSGMDHMTTDMEQLAFKTGGESVVIMDKSNMTRPSLAVYVNLMDAFRLIRRKTLPQPSSLVINDNIFIRLFITIFHFSCMKLCTTAFKRARMIKRIILLWTCIQAGTPVSSSILQTWLKVT